VLRRYQPGSAFAPLTYNKAGRESWPPIAGGGGTQLAAAHCPCSSLARAKTALFEVAPAEFAGFERARLSWVPPEASSAAKVPVWPSAPSRCF
jgi:hypothetical protein